MFKHCLFKNVRFTPRLTIALGACVSWILIGAHPIAAQSSPGLQDYSVNSARPLHDALWRIQSSLRVPIDFEQGPPVTSAELMSGKERPGLRPDRYYLRRQTLSVHFVAGETSALAAAQTAVAAYAQSGLPGKFVVTQPGGTIVVKPETNALSDLPITIPEAERSPEATANLITQELARVSGKKVLFLSQPYGDTALMKYSASNEPVGEALAKWGAEVGPTSFRLLYDPTREAYCLSFNSVPNLPAEFQATTSQLPQQGGHRPTSSPFFTKDKP